MDVKTIMDTWTLQMGFPVVTIKRVKKTNKAIAKQKHFLLDPNAVVKESSPFKWVSNKQRYDIWQPTTEVMHSLVSCFCCHRTKLLCWENHPQVGRQRVAVSRGDYRELRLSFLDISVWKMHKFRLFTSKQWKLAYVSEREIDPFHLVNHVVQNFHAGEQ